MASEGEILMTWLVRLVLALVLIDSGQLRAEPVSEAAELQTQAEALFAPGQDWADIKFAVDKLAESSSDGTASRAELARLTAALHSFMSGIASRSAYDRLKRLRQFYYEAGPWNDNRPFAYDMDDPLGQVSDHKTLAYYLATRKGNCITMPVLFAILGRGIGLNLTLATAPRHMFVKFTGDDGRVWNLETTSGAGYTRDLHYRKELPMSDKAVASGLYLKKLSDEEAIAEIASYAVERLLQQQRYEEAIAVSDVILKHHSKSLYTLIARGSAFGLILRRDFLDRYQSLDQMLPHEQIKAQMLSEQNYMAFARAEALGWTEHDGLKEKWPPYPGR
jgi:regulator of sirC expression with transglutaminase-like and TPR domain